MEHFKNQLLKKRYRHPGTPVLSVLTIIFFAVTIWMVCSSAQIKEILICAVVTIILAAIIMLALSVEKDAKIKLEKSIHRFEIDGTLSLIYDDYRATEDVITFKKIPLILTNHYLLFFDIEGMHVVSLKEVTQCFSTHSGQGHQQVRILGIAFETEKEVYSVEARMYESRLNKAILNKAIKKIRTRINE